MRKAEVKAGIINEKNSFNVLLCLEPEGASIQVREDSEEALKKQIIKGILLYLFSYFLSISSFFSLFFSSLGFWFSSFIIFSLDILLSFLIFFDDLFSFVSVFSLFSSFC